MGIQEGLVEPVLPLCPHKARMGDEGQGKRSGDEERRRYQVLLERLSQDVLIVVEALDLLLTRDEKGFCLKHQEAGETHPEQRLHRILIVIAPLMPRFDGCTVMVDTGSNEGDSAKDERFASERNGKRERRCIRVDATHILRLSGKGIKSTRGQEKNKKSLTPPCISPCDRTHFPASDDFVTIFDLLSGPTSLMHGDVLTWINL